MEAHCHMDKVQTAVMEALEASVFKMPLAPGLSEDEIIHVLTRIDFKLGEIKDAIAMLWNEQRIQRLNNDLWHINVAEYAFFLMMSGRKYENYPANPVAVDFPVKYLRELQREVGRNNAKVQRNVLVAEGMRLKMSENDLEVAITLLSYCRVLNIENDLVSLPDGKDWAPLYSEYLGNSHPFFPRPVFDKVLPIVADVIDRRTDGRRPSSDSLEAFSSILKGLGFANFSVWWLSTYHEYLSNNPLNSPKSSLVLAAALCEGMLSLVAELARSKDLSMAKGLDDDPKNWKLAKLVEAACSGQHPIISNPNLRAGLLDLNRNRQSIHVGALIGQYGKTSLVPDVWNEDARLAKENAHLLARSILDWADTNHLVGP